MTRTPILLSIALISILGSACHFASTFQFTAGVDPEGPGTQFQTVCHDAAVLSCEYEARCDPASFEEFWADETTCEDRSTLDCQLEAIDPDAHYDEASILACVHPPDFPCPFDQGYSAMESAFEAQCHPPPGNLKDGSECTENSACVGGTCAFETAAACSTCQTRPCGDGCGKGEICVTGESLTSDASSCAVVADVGAPCSADADCATFLCHKGVCTAHAKVGEPCDPSDIDSTCEVGAFFCDPDAKVCAQYLLAKANEPCGELTEGYTLCIQGATCPGNTLTGRCIPPVPDGLLCDPAQALNCLFPATCVDGYCRFHRDPCIAAN